MKNKGISPIYFTYKAGCPSVQNRSHYSLSVFDRWGRKIFQGTDAEGGWDGSEDGSAAPTGTYLWIAHYIIGSDHTATEQKGAVTLLR